MQTKGQYRVGTQFNPSSKSIVDSIKEKAAELIDLIDSIPTGLNGSDTVSTAEAGVEIQELKTLAVRGVEGAAHWAVKAATKPNRILT